MGVPINRLLTAITTLAAVVYPFIIYGLLKLFSVRHAGAILLALLLLVYGRRLAAHRTLWVLIGIQFGGVAVLTAGAAIWNNRLALMLVPVFISLYLLATFLYTLARPPSMIARYATATGGQLSPGEQQYCRAVTWIWSAFFVLNGSITAILALKDLFQWWTLYAGLISYVLIGTLFGVEFTVRRYRFGKFTDHPLDQLLARVMGRRHTA